MKKLFILIAIVVVIGLAAPFFIGNQAEAEFRKMYDDINLGPDLTFEVTEYNKGWFSSTATVAAVIDMSAARPGTTEKFTTYLRHEIQHGPILTQAKEMGIGILDVNMTIEAPEVLTSEMPEFNKILNEVVSLSSRVAMNGNVDSVININGYEHTEDGATITVNTGAINFNTAPDKKVVFDGDWQGLTMTKPGEGEFVISSVSMDGDMVPPEDLQMAAFGIYAGTSKAAIEEIKFTGASPMENFVMKNMVMTSGSDISDDTMSGTIDMTVDEINVMGMTFTDFIYDLGINSLNIPALMKVNELASKMDNPQVTEQDVNAMMDALMMLLEGQPELVINNLGITTEQGVIKNTANFGIDTNLIDPKNPLTLMTGVKIDAQGSIPEAFLQSMGVMPMLQSYITDGYLEVEGGTVNYDMVFEGGQMLMFGKPYSWNRLLN